MLEDQDSDFILSIFLMEAWDTVATVEEGARRLGGGEPPSSGMIDPLVVVTHRLKGAAALHGYPVVSAVVLVMENLLEQLPALPAPERGRKVEVLGNVVVAVKRTLEELRARKQASTAERSRGQQSKQARTPVDQLDVDHRAALRPRPDVHGRRGPIRTIARR